MSDSESESGLVISPPGVTVTAAPARRDRASGRAAGGVPVTPMIESDCAAGGTASGRRRGPAVPEILLSQQPARAASTLTRTHWQNGMFKLVYL